MTGAPAPVRILAVLLALVAGGSRAQEAVAVSGRLSDADFYRLVSCAAPPGGACAAPALRWPAERPIRVALRRIDPAYVGRRKPRAEAALTQALRTLNAAGAGFRLARVGPADPAEIAVFFLDLAAGQPIAGTAIAWVDGQALDRVATLIAVDPDRTRIRGAVIVAGASLETAAYEAAMLKSLTRAMGLMTEIDGPVYAEVSVLARARPGATRLGPQDLAALRRHYAAPARPDPWQVEDDDAAGQ